MDRFSRKDAKLFSCTSVHCSNTEAAEAVRHRCQFPTPCVTKGAAETVDFIIFQNYTEVSLPIRILFCDIARKGPKSANVQNLPIPTLASTYRLRDIQHNRFMHRPTKYLRRCAFHQMRCRVRDSQDGTFPHSHIPTRLGETCRQCDQFHTDLIVAKYRISVCQPGN